ncbi:MAG: TraR/DksA C4-type zinc finger protein [Deltaproteobacteria bacterium]|nr:TraR/DksA C4-type zinc finger protein [Deltaproteobacteria bacterium]MBW2120905.1 TraR/DksA C4-type zinc finger protein [Deltaproteobacteria bacterium]
MVKSHDKSDRKERLREMLLQKRREIETRIADEVGEKMAEDIASTLGPALDEGDLSTLDVSRDLDYRVLTMYTEMLKNVDRALERLEEGTYGTCEECGKEIKEKRLQVLPFARYCVECQREKEKVAETDSGRTWMERRAQAEQSQMETDEDI